MTYDYDDLITDTMTSKPNRKTFDEILRPKLKHINTHITRRPKTRVIIGMVRTIFRVSLKLFIKHLFKGEKVEIPGIGYIVIETRKFNNNYKGKDRQKQKISDRSDGIILYPDEQKKKYKKSVYLIWFHGNTQKAFEKIIQSGKKYI